MPKTGVSSIIGIILMVAVSVALVALASTLVFDITGNVNEPSTGSSVNIEPQQQSDNILVNVNRNPDLERVFVRGDGINEEQEIVDSEGQTGTVSISPSSTEGTVEVVGETEDGSEQVLDTREYEDYSGTGSGKSAGGNSNNGVSGVVKVNPLIDGANVKAVKPDGTTIATDVTDSNGEYNLGVPPSEFERVVVNVNGADELSNPLYTSDIKMADSGDVNFNFDETSKMTTDLNGDGNDEFIIFETDSNGNKLVGDIFQLQAIGNDLSASYKLVDDIDASGTDQWNSGDGFASIGNSSNPFSGALIGNGYVVKDLYMSSDSNSGMTFINETTSSFEMTHIGFVNVRMVDGFEFEIRKSPKKSGLVGVNNGDISEVYIDMKVDNVDGLGTIAYNNSGDIQSTSIVVEQVGESKVMAGVSYNNTGAIKDSYITGTLYESPVSYFNSGTISNVYWDNNNIQYDAIAGLGSSEGIPVHGFKMLGSSGESTMSGLDFSTTWKTVDKKMPVLRSINRTEQVNSQLDRYNSYLNENCPMVTYSTDSNGNRLVSTPKELQCIAWYQDNDYKLTDNIDLSGSNSWDNGSGFYPIGRGDLPFNGSIDGNGKTITDLYINRGQRAEVGLIGKGKDAVVKDISVTNADVTGESSVGIIGGHIRSSPKTLESISVTGTVKGGGGAAGIIGTSDNVDIADSTSDISLSVYEQPSSDSLTLGTNMAGLVGHATNNTVISNSSSDGIIRGDRNVGGLVGWLDESEVDSSNSTVTVKSGTKAPEEYTKEAIGGLVGSAKHSTISKSYSTGSVENLASAPAEDIGGLVGWLDGTASYNRDTKLTESYTTADVVGWDSTYSYRVGGIVGTLRDATVERTYATGTIEGSDDVGGAVGYNIRGNIESSVYWDTEESGITTSDGGGTGLTTSEMQGSSASSNMIELDFSSGGNWNTVSGQYPVLKASE